MRIAAKSLLAALILGLIALSVGKGGYIPMGFQPAVRQFADGTEVAYVLTHGETRCDPRWDSHLGSWC